MEGDKIKIKEAHPKKKQNHKWTVFITLFTFFTSVLLTLLSDSIMPSSAVYIAVVILILFVGAGIVFDVIGLAVATAGEAPFHSMAARKVKGASQAIRLIRNAEKVSNLCNDVVGDIVSIVSGSTTAAIVTRLSLSYGLGSVYLSLVLTGMVAALTVGGKAVGKGIAISGANRITYRVALFIYYVDKFRVKGERNGDFKQNK